MVREVDRVLWGVKTPQNGQQSPRKGEERLRQVLLQFQRSFEEERGASLRDREIKLEERSIHKFGELLDHYECQLKGGFREKRAGLVVRVESRKADRACS